MKNWKVNSWRKFPVKHIPEYPDKKELDQVLDKMRTFPPLVFAGETRHLKQQLAEVVDGKAFLLQGGDCAESFAEFLPHIDSMKDNISKVIGLERDLIGIKATTNETLGPEGREEGISCHSVVLLEKE